ncbi:hypothetical protein [Prosthecobacter sp.]|uniref:hypothetical protein n=1 Tax=Prosthecobacter sp. TaxID=1965333 RepID=UPI00378452D7
MKLSILFLAAISLAATSCANRPLTAQEQKALVTAEDVALSGISGLANGGRTGAILGAVGALKRNLPSAKQPQNVTP